MQQHEPTSTAASRRLRVLAAQQQQQLAAAEAAADQVLLTRNATSAGEQQQDDVAARQEALMTQTEPYAVPLPESLYPDHPWRVYRCVCGAAGVLVGVHTLCVWTYVDVCVSLC